VTAKSRSTEFTDVQGSAVQAPPVHAPLDPVERSDEGGFLRIVVAVVDMRVEAWCKSTVISRSPAG
jgi:hypothetical protein